MFRCFPKRAKSFSVSGCLAAASDAAAVAAVVACRREFERKAEQDWKEISERKPRSGTADALKGRKESMARWRLGASCTNQCAEAEHLKSSTRKKKKVLS